ncbi:MAG: lytic transglycosylase domain-containing protein [Alphaproteobacteria bacterium]|nr:MAG: lytic transglycosylase domain-containing protein [Alphaproteobacteria bacterium]
MMKTTALQKAAALAVCVLFLSAPAYAGDGDADGNFLQNLWSAIAPRPAPVADSVKEATAVPARKPENAAAAKKPDDAQDVTVHEHEISFADIFETAPPAQKPLPKDPKIRLSDHDKELYRKVFDLQSRGDWDDADEQIAHLSDLRLLGYLTYQRYMHPRYITTRDELAGWLDAYGHYAVASDIYRLASRKFGAGGFKKPQSKKTLAHQVIVDSAYATRAYKSTKRRSNAQERDVRDLKRQISSLLSRDAPSAALRKLENTPAKSLMDNAEYDILQADIAAAYFYLQLFDKAAPLAVVAAERSGRNAPMAGWIAGLTAWLNQDYDAATGYFARTAESQRSSRAMKAASSYWAARSALRAGNPRVSGLWLKLSSQYPRSFYGLIARQTLGVRSHQFDWSLPVQDEAAHVLPVLESATGRRAIALLDAGQSTLATEELQTVQLQNSGSQLKEALFVLANLYDMPGLSMQLASSVKRSNGKLYDNALYPLSPWQPEGGFNVSPALAHAFIRQESRFHPHVESRSGALGLMQLMPKTASYIAGKPASFFSKSEGQDMLLDPVYNLTLGQDYIQRLTEYSQVGDSLLKLVASYNAGPGRLARWHGNMMKVSGFGDDPLLFLAMLPAAETRVFTEQVMANYWIYNLRLTGKTPESLRSVAAGKWPSYDADRRVELARSEPQRKGWLFHR